MTGDDAVAATRLIEALGSCDPVRVAEAVRDLDLRWQTLADVPLPAPPVDVLEAVDADIAEDVAVAYVNALLLYDFTPPVDVHDRLRWMITALVRYGGSRLATNLALKLADPESLGARATDALALIEQSDLHDRRARMAVCWLVSFLIGFPRTRQPTLDTIAGWSTHPVLSAVVEFVAPQLSPDEQARVRRTSADPE